MMSTRRRFQSLLLAWGSIFFLATNAVADVCVSGAGASEWNGTYVFDVGLGRYDLDGTHVLYNEFGVWVMRHSIGMGNPSAYSGSNVDGTPEGSTYSVDSIGTAPAPVVSAGACGAATPTPTATATPTATPQATATVVPTVAPTGTPIATPTPNAQSCIFATGPGQLRALEKRELSIQRKTFVAKQVDLTLYLPMGWSAAEGIPLVKSIRKDLNNSCPGVSATSSSVNAASNGIAVAVALGDANGHVTFTVPEGEYELTFDYGDRVVSPSTIDISTDTPVVTQSFDVTAKDLHDEGCERTIATSGVKKAIDAISAQSRYAVGLYRKYSAAAGKTAKGKKASAALLKAGLKIVQAKSAAIFTSSDFPVMQLSCHGKATCTTTSYASSSSKIVASMKTIQKQTVALATIAHRSLKKVPLSAITRTSQRLYQAALKASKQLPVRSDTCSG